MGRRKHIPPFETEITHMGPKGVGIGRAPDGREVHIRAAPVGSRVAVRPAGRKKSIYKGIRTALIRPPSPAATPPCPQFGLCGGCVLQELPLEIQRHYKHEQALAAVGPAPSHPVRGSALAYGYRNKMEFSFGTQRYLSQQDLDAGLPIDGRFLGLHAPGRFDRVVDSPHCDLLDDIGNQVLSAVRAYTLHEAGPDIWDVRAHVGFLRHLLIRRGEDAVYVGLFTTSDPSKKPFVDGLFEALQRLSLGNTVVSAGWYTNDLLADVAQGTLQPNSLGPAMFPIRLHGHRFEIAPLAFFQTSTTGAEILISTIAEALGSGHKLLLDLYCGTGSIGICLTEHADTVVGIELNAAAIENARANAKANQVDARYRVAKVEDVLEELSGGTGVAAVVDPPRVGLHPKVAKALATAPLDVLVYVACSAASLGRDRAILEEGGWTITQLWTVDLFPQTGHIEVIARFERP